MAELNTKVLSVRSCGGTNFSSEQSLGMGSAINVVLISELDL
jgi:hypothetical protein